MNVKVLVAVAVAAVVLFGAAVALGARDGGKVEPDPEGVLGDVRSLLGGDRRLEREDVASACFDGVNLRVPAGFPCTVEVPADVRVVDLRVVAGTVDAAEVVQEGALDQSDGPFGPGEDIGLDLFGEGGTVTLTCLAGCLVSIP